MSRWIDLIDVIQIGVLLVPSIMFLVRFYTWRGALELLGLLIGSVVYIWIILLVLGLLQLVKFTLGRKSSGGI